MSNRTSNLVAELRKIGACGYCNQDPSAAEATLQGAADAIERLTRELEEFKECYREDGMDKVFAERDRLRAALERIADAPRELSGERCTEIAREALAGAADETSAVRYTPCECSCHQTGLLCMECCAGPPVNGEGSR